jgi:hypothetical protein
MKYVVHHARLKDILEELIVVNGATRFDLQNPPFTGSMGVCVEALQYFAFAPKKYRDYNFFFAGLPFFNPKSQFLEAWPESCHNGVAVLHRHCA